MLAHCGIVMTWHCIVVSVTASCCVVCVVMLSSASDIFNLCLVSVYTLCVCCVSLVLSGVRE